MEGMLEERASIYSVRCMSCATTVPLGEHIVRGEALVCPRCGCSLTQDDYDAFAAELNERRCELQQLRIYKIEELSQLRARCARWGIFAGIARWIKRKQITNLGKEIAKLKWKTNKRYKRIQSLAESRYYASDWFATTGTPLSTNERKTAFQDPHYVLKRDGSVVFSCMRKKGCKKSKGEAYARYAEFEAFEQLRRLVNTGALGHCRILAGLMVPYDEDRKQKYNKKIKCSEIDLLLVSQRGVLVIEVKRTRYMVEVDYNPMSRRYQVERISCDKEGKPCGVPQEDRAVNQNYQHICALSQQWIYTLDESCFSNIVMYASARQLKLKAELGHGKFPTYLVSLEDEKNFEKVITEAVMQAPVMRSEDEVDVVADELRARFGDFEMKKVRQHVERLQEQQKFNERVVESLQEYVKAGQVQEESSEEEVLLAL